jgi:ubiquitin carboxyl-terminal hydrolase 47
LRGAAEAKSWGTSHAKLKKTDSEIEEEELHKALQAIKEQEMAEKMADRKSGNTIEYYLTKGENVYELYSIMIHTGGAHGGHYFSYIKSFEDGKWHNFNDSSVTEIKDPDQEIMQTFGGQNSKTAYMLMYRRVTGKEELYKFENCHIPDYLKEEI